MPIYKCCFKRAAYIATVILYVCCIFAVPRHAYAKEGVPDKFRIALGGYTLARYDSEVSLVEPDLGAGVSISPADTLGIDTQQTVFRLDGYYRFNSRHSLTFSWYKITNTGTKSVETEFDWLDENGNTITIPVGARVDTSMVYDIYKVGYLWSFYSTDKVELAVGAGLHITRTSISLQAEATGTGIDTTDVAVTVPLPVLSIGLAYKITPKFGWFYKSEIFALTFDKWEGTYADGTLGMEYRVWENIGLGLGLGSKALKVIEKTGDYKFAFSNRISGLQVFVAGYF
jgi:hypothetical protein